MCAPMPGEDFQIFEQDLPGENAAGFNTGQDLRRLAAGNLHDDQPVVGLQLARHRITRAPSRSSGPSSWPPGEVRTCS